MRRAARTLVLPVAYAFGWLGCAFKTETVSSGSAVDGDVVTPPPYILTIGPNGASPQVLHVWQDNRATIVNADSRPHNIMADAHPTHYYCGGILNLGALEPGVRREVTQLPINACFFHDENDPQAREFWAYWSCTSIEDRERLLGRRSPNQLRCNRLLL